MTYDLAINPVTCIVAKLLGEHALFLVSAFGHVLAGFLYEETTPIQSVFMNVVFVGFIPARVICLEGIAKCLAFASEKPTRSPSCVGRQWRLHVL